MELAQSVAGDAELDEWAVLDHLSALVDKSLVVAEVGDVPRYRLLESARAFAIEQLAHHGRADQAAQEIAGEIDATRRTAIGRCRAADKTRRISATFDSTPLSRSNFDFV